MNLKFVQQYSKFTDKGPSIAERVVRSVCNLLKNPVFGRKNADWKSELSSDINKYKKTIHHSIKITPIEASKKFNEKVVYNNLNDNREIQKLKFNLGDLIRTSDIKESLAREIVKIGVIFCIQ